MRIEVPIEPPPPLEYASAHQINPSNFGEFIVLSNFVINIIKRSASRSVQTLEKIRGFRSQAPL